MTVPAPSMGSGTSLDFLGTHLFWIPVFVGRPHTQLAKVLTVIWVTVFISMGLIFKLPFLGAAIDLLFERKAWPVQGQALMS